MYRCDEIAEQAVKNFIQALTPFKRTLEKGDMVEDFGKKVTQLFNTALGTISIDSSLIVHQSYTFLSYHTLLPLSSLRDS